MNEHTLWVELEQAVRNIKAHYAAVPIAPSAPHVSRRQIGAFNLYANDCCAVYKTLEQALDMASSCCTGTYHITVLSDGSDPQIERVEE